jgi:hypothetical protein
LIPLRCAAFVVVPADEVLFFKCDSKVTVTVSGITANFLRTGVIGFTVKETLVDTDRALVVRGIYILVLCDDWRVNFRPGGTDQGS